MTGAELEEIGAGAFDIVQVGNEFAEEHPDLVRKFLAVTDKANAAYTANPDSVYETVSGAAGMDLEATKAMMSKFTFPTNEEQAGPNWLGGENQEMAPAIMEVMVQGGRRGQAARRLFQLHRPELLEVADNERGRVCARTVSGRQYERHRRRSRFHGLHDAGGRRRACARQHFARHPSGRDGVGARSVGLWKDDAAQHPRRFPRSDLRQRAAQRRGGSRPQRQARHGVPAGRAVRVADGQRQRRLRAENGRPAARRDPRNGGAAARHCRARAVSARSPSTSFRAACSSAWRSPGASPTIPKSC